MPERLRCEGCNGVAREECDQGFLTAALSQTVRSAIGIFPALGFEKVAGKTVIVEYDPGSKEAMDKAQWWRDSMLAEFFTEQTARGCTLTEAQISEAVYREEQAIRTEKPDEVARLEDIMINFIKESRKDNEQ